MKQVDSISVKELTELAQGMFGELVKADVDVIKKIIVIDMPMHYEGEAFLLDNGSKQNDIWGINLHPAEYKTEDFIEYDPMINIRPSQGNPSRDVLDESVREEIRKIVCGAVYE